MQDWPFCVCLKMCNQQFPLAQVGNFVTEEHGIYKKSSLEFSSVLIFFIFYKQFLKNLHRNFSLLIIAPEMFKYLPCNIHNKVHLNFELAYRNTILNNNQIMSSYFFFPVHSIWKAKTFIIGYCSAFKHNTRIDILEVK